MSMHKKPLTQLEEEGLRAHGLPIGTPSQLSDVFRHGVAWAAAQDQGEVQRLRPAIAMVLQALDRDAAEGKAARGEMAAELRAALAASTGQEE